MRVPFQLLVLPDPSKGLQHGPVTGSSLGMSLVSCTNWMECWEKSVAVCCKARCQCMPALSCWM